MLTTIIIFWVGAMLGSLGTALVVMGRDFDRDYGDYED